VQYFSLTCHNVTPYTNCLSCFRMVGCWSRKPLYLSTQNLIWMFGILFHQNTWKWVNFVVDCLSGENNYLIFCTKLSNQCCRISYYPQWRRNHCAGYDKARSTPVTYIPVLTARSWLEHRNRTVYFLYYSATDVES